MSKSRFLKLFNIDREYSLLITSLNRHDYLSSALHDRSLLTEGKRGCLTQVEAYAVTVSIRVNLDRHLSKILTSV